jgi:hypothetical protein
MTETTEVTGPPKKKHSLVTALLMMGLGGFLVFNYIFSDMFPSEEEKQARAAAAQAVIDEGQAYLKDFRWVYMRCTHQRNGESNLTKSFSRKSFSQLGKQGNTTVNL